MKKFNKKIKRSDIWDIKLMKLSSMAFILFLITVWPAVMDLVHRVHWGWFLGAMVLLAIRPMKKMWGK